MALRIVLMGTGDFALPPFQALMESEHGVVGVFTQPDKTGRGHHHHVNPVKALAVQHQIPVYQPDRVNRKDVLEQLRSLQADVFIVAAYGQILKPELLAIPRLGAFNLHGSLLPRHRGAAPVQYSIWKGDRTTGVTIFRIEPALDSGPIVGTTTTEIGPQETSEELMQRLAVASVPLTLDVVRRLELGTAVPIVQDSSQVTLAPRISREDGEIDWSQSRHRIDCQIRAMQPWPKASSWLIRDQHPPIRCILLKANHDASAVPEMPATAVSPRMFGQIVTTAGKLLVQCGDGLLEVLRLQPEGRKPMDGIAFLNGHALSVHDRFSRSPGA